MGSSITARFYQITKPESVQETFIDALAAANKIPTANRTLVLDGGLEVRLENLEKTGNFVVGDLTRIQRENLPSEVHDDKVNKLSVPYPLGHSLAFAINLSYPVIALQYDITTISPGRLPEYLRKLDDNNIFYLHPVLNEGAWALFANHTVKKFSVKVAVPKNFQFLDNTPDVMGLSIKQMAEFYQAPYITIEVGVGNRKQTIVDSVKETASRLFKLGVDVRSMTANVVGVTEEIDLTHSLMKARDVLDLHENDPQKSYETRIRFLMESFREKNQALKTMFG